MSVEYSPPYDSPIEDLFVWNFAKYAHEDVQLKCQVPVNTICGLFVIDFVAYSPKIGRIAFECDGKEFHSASRDEWRDAMILGKEAVDVIYRLRGCDIYYHINDLLFLISQLEPSITSERGEINLHILASYEMKKISIDRAKDYYNVLYKESSIQMDSLRLETRRRFFPKNERRFWHDAYRYAVSIGGGSLDDVMRSHRKKSDLLFN